MLIFLIIRFPFIFSTPLFDAVKDGDFDQVQQLINLKADVDLNYNGHIPLTLAAHQGCAEMVELLLKLKADLNNVDRWGNTATIVASTYGHLDVVKLLMSKRADVNVNCEAVLGTSALISAVRNGHYKIAELLYFDGGAKFEKTKLLNSWLPESYRLFLENLQKRKGCVFFSLVNYLAPLPQNSVTDIFEPIEHTVKSLFFQQTQKNT
jgi:ankyrin repeat protein